MTKSIDMDPRFEICKVMRNKLVSVHIDNIKRNQGRYLPIGSRCP